MTLLLERPEEAAPPMSVAARKFEAGNEVNMMIAAGAFDHEIERLLAPPQRANTLGRAATRIGVALVKWGRRRAERGVLTHEEQARRITTEKAVASAASLPHGRPILY